MAYLTLLQCPIFTAGYSIELTFEVMDHLGLPDLAILSATSKTVRSYTQQHLHHRVVQQLAPFGIPTDTLLAILRKSCSVISGSTALHVYLPREHRLWAPGDIDVYTTEQGFSTIMAVFLTHGYDLASEFAKIGSTQRADIAKRYDFQCDIQRVVKLTRASRSVDIIVSNTQSPIRPIFHFHSTAVMNYISGHGLFCAYPAWMRMRISVINPLLYSREHLPNEQAPLGPRATECIAKYRDRGFRCVGRSEIEHHQLGCRSPLCPNPDRYTHDGACLFVPFSDCQRTTASSRITVLQRTYLLSHDVQWSLGSDSCADGFADTEAYVL